MSKKLKKIAESEKAMEAVEALGTLLDVDLEGKEGEELATVVLDAYENKEEPKSILDEAIDAAASKLIDALDEIVGETEDEDLEKEDEEDKKEDEDLEKEDKEVKEDEEDLEKEDKEEEDLEEKDKKEEDLEKEDEEDKKEEEEELKKSAYTVSEASYLAENLMNFANNLEFSEEWGESPANLAAEIKEIAVSLYQKFSELAVFEAQRVISQVKPDVSETEVVEVIEEIQKSFSIYKKEIQDLKSELETIKKSRFHPRELRKDGLSIITKGGDELITKSISEAKGAGADMKTVLKAMFEGKIRES